MSEIEFFYDFGSPNAYIAHKQLPNIADEFGAAVRYRPILLGGVFKGTNNQAPFGAFSEVKGKVDYIRLEFQRYIERHQIEFHWNKHFPVNTLMLMRAAVYAEGKPWENTLLKAGFDAMWLNSVDMSDATQFANTLADANLPAEEILEAIQMPETKARLVDATQAAIDRGIFGAPTMFLKDEMFFGKDAISDLRWRLGNQTESSDGGP